MRYVMVSLAGANLMCVIFNILAGNWGVAILNLIAVVSCTGAAILND